MRFETSSDVSEADIKANEKSLRDAAVKSGNDKFFGANEKIEVAKDPSYPSVENLAEKARNEVKPAGDPTVCAIAYEIAKAACQGNPICLAIAAAAYQACLRS